MGDALVEIVGDEIEDVLFEVGAGADDAVNFSLADHFSEGNAQLGRAHGASEGHEHDTALIEVAGVGFRGVFECGGIEVTIVKVDELRDGTGLHGGEFYGWLREKKGLSFTESVERLFTRCIKKIIFREPRIFFLTM